MVNLILVEELTEKFVYIFPYHSQITIKLCILCNLLRAGRRNFTFDEANNIPFKITIIHAHVAGFLVELIGNLDRSQHGLAGVVA